MFIISTVAIINEIQGYITEYSSNICGMAVLEFFRSISHGANIYYISKCPLIVEFIGTALIIYV